MHHSCTTDTPTLILVILIKSCLRADTAVFMLQPKKVLGRCILNCTSSVIKVLFQKKIGGRLFCSGREVKTLVED